MFGTYEFLYLLFSMSEMMLTVSVKPFIVNIIQKQELRIGSVFEDRPQMISNETMAGSEVTEGTVTLNSTGIQNSEPQDKHILDSRKEIETMPTAGQSALESEVEAKAGIYLMIDQAGSHLPWMIVGPVCGVWSDSMSDMILTVSVKPFIVYVVQKQDLHMGSVSEDRPQMISSVALSGSEVTEGTVTLNSTGIQNSEPQDKHILDNRKGSGEIPTAGQSALESEVEAKAGIYLMIDRAGSHLPWMIVGPVCGVWSDRHGRKLPLLISSVDHVISVVFYMLAQYHPDHLLVTVILGSVSRGFGTNAMFTMVIYSMTSDTSCDSQRSSRFASLTASRYIGLCLGSLSTGFLVDSVGVLYSLVASSVLQTLVFLVIIIFVKETLQQSQPGTDNTSHSSSNALFPNNPCVLLLY
ncbi:hypothetical protein BaRGS_00018870 [Batillaria attramentaria]|uniref:Major facilitator superfamily (MFS) profile domain-containing protein n=1 Tax=Batillaria attramentaria TaxID=370345 RepID=A0ABD0KRF3_9CAEN